MSELLSETCREEYYEGLVNLEQPDGIMAQAAGLWRALFFDERFVTLTMEPGIGVKLTVPIAMWSSVRSRLKPSVPFPAWSR